MTERKIAKIAVAIWFTNVIVWVASIRNNSRTVEDRHLKAMLDSEQDDGNFFKPWRAWRAKPFTWRDLCKLSLPPAFILPILAVLLLGRALEKKDRSVPPPA